MDVTAIAAQNQRSGGYSVDTWIALEVPPMTKLWQGANKGNVNISNYFFSEQDAREVTGAYTETQAYRFAETLWRMAQVRPHPEHGFRSGIIEYVVDLPLTAAVGVCRANTAYGSGSIFQYFIADGDLDKVFSTGRRFKFERTRY
ncbi:hypothetical protein G6O69_35015 [Pseudenhygromyxa sp. WMMC2535]|uniref:hypothetical protein n=1 Tax=Pseudenhygromyxa sp. WMMC2535 TaxID=2712867 RepID=UPI0015526FA3|nr:hypothetical protein [Pseudenhygromyxa sp. WMMC2535]NVB43087.1 hypothetical protein [Pseudenhygromyxa sp. WMMC2535]